MTVAEFLRNRMLGLVARPEMWGTTFAVECQMMLLVECWQVNETGEHVDVSREWVRYLYENDAPGPNNWPLARRKGFGEATDEFKAFVAGFIKEQTGVTP